MKGRLYEAEVAWAETFTVIIFLVVAWGAAGNFLVAIRAVGGVAVLLGADNKDR